MSEKQQLRVELSGRGNMQSGPAAKMSVIPLSKDAKSVCLGGRSWDRQGRHLGPETVALPLCLSFVVNSVGGAGRLKQGSVH